jgi:hypothetical protein
VVIGKATHATLKAGKEDRSAPGPPNVAINIKTHMPEVNYKPIDEAVLPAPALSTS